MNDLLDKNDVNSVELEELLDLRKKGEVDFLLVDIREEYEYEMEYIDGVDILKPTSLFQEWAQAFLTETKDKKVILTCRTGSRTGQVQGIFQQHGHKNVINHWGGIVTYRGKTIRG